MAKKHEYTEKFGEFWNEYPKRCGGNPKRSAFIAWNARIKSGASEDEILSGMARYKKFIIETKKENTCFVQQARTFLGPDEHYLEQWEVPKPETVYPKNNNEWMSMGKSLNLPARPGEEMPEYIQRLQSAMR